MAESKADTGRASASTFGKTDFAKVDAHEIAPQEYEELPELTDQMMARADHYVGDRLIRRGLPSAEASKKLVSIRLSSTVLAHFSAGGRDWETRIDDILLDAVRRETATAEE